MANVSPAKAIHSIEIVRIMEEMDRFYGVTDVESTEQRIRQINDALFGDPPSAYMLLAWDEEELVGFASYSFIWPAIGLTRSLYLKELYVTATVRRAGVGRLLMQHLFDIAARNACSRVEWTTDSDNLEAQLFYEKLGVPVKESKLFYRVEGDELTQRARGSERP